jgi:LacI family transcriptional regulator
MAAGRWTGRAAAGPTIAGVTSSKPAPPRKPAAATIADVARHAGVSPMTVSRVVNGEAGVRPPTRERVQAAIAALHYMPNPAARHLAGSELIRLGVLHGSARSGYLAEFLVGLMNQASQSHVQLLVQQCTDVAARPAEVRSLAASGIDGLILPPPLCDEQALLDVAAAAHVPTVVVGAGLPDARVNAVNIDDYQAALTMTRHLIALGHQRVGFIGGNPNQTASSCRLAGFRDAMAEAALPPAPELVVPGLFNYRSGLDGAELLLALEPRPTAIFASNDDMAAATVAVAHRLGLDVPGDLTVVGCDDTAIATTIWPELTTIRQPITEMARAAVNLLVRRVRAQRAGTLEAPQQDRVAFELVRRQSDAAPRQRPAVRLVDAAAAPAAAGTPRTRRRS